MPLRTEDSQHLRGRKAVQAGQGSGSSSEGAVGSSTSRSTDSRSKAYTAMPVVELILLALLVASIAWTFAVVLRDPAGLQVAWLCGFLLGTEFLVYLSRQFFRRFGTWVSETAAAHGLVASPPLANPSAMTKWLEQSWQLTVHVMFASIEYVLLFVAPREEVGIPAMWDVENLHRVWEPLPWELGQQEVHWLRLLCLAQVAVWIYTAGMHVFYDKRRKDYQVMLTHHVVTIGLLAGAMEKNYLRIALIVLYLNDATDVFIDTLKMANYAKLRGGKAYYIAEVAFIGVIGSMGYFRMYHEPIRVNYTTSVVAHKVAVSVMDPAKRERIGIDADTPIWSIFGQRNWSYHPNDENDYFELLNILLIILFILHLYWFLLMIKILFIVLTKDAQSASREEYEGDSDEEEDDEQGGNESYVFATTLFRLLFPLSATRKKDT